MPRRVSLFSAALALAALASPPGAGAQAVEHPFTYSLLPGRLPTLLFPRFVWGDVDRDGDLDLVAMGVRVDGAARSAYSAVLRNDGRVADALAPGGTSIAFTAVPLPVALAHGDADLGDVDRDGDLDLVVTGSRSADIPHQPVARLYRNDGGTFRDAGVALPAVFGGGARLADLDRDGALDLVLTGAAETRAPYTPTARVLRQVGAWTFADAGAQGLPGHAFGDLRTLDADADGDLDVLLGGVTSEGLATRLYLNGGGAFTASTLSLPGGVLARHDAVRTAGRLDIVASAALPSPIGLEGRAALSIGGTAAPAPALAGGAMLWNDWDDDGDPDLLAAGRQRLDAPTETRLLRRSVVGMFDLAGHLEGVRDGSAVFGDADGDGDLDLAASGLNRGDVVVGALYRNDRWGRATTPSQPRGLVATPENGGLRLRWEPVEGAASYDVRVGSAPGGVDLVSVPADAAGQRQVAAPGALVAPTAWLSPALLAGRTSVHVGVQAVSAGFAGSAFAVASVETASSTDADVPARPTAWALAPPSPAPLASRGVVRVSVPADAPVRLDAVDALGRTVARLADAVLRTGVHEIALDAAAWPAGLYVLRLTTPAGVVTRPLVVHR